jgi:hypothetical protein
MSEAPRDLGTASREELLALIARQARVITTLQQRSIQVEQRLGPSVGKGVPGTKPAQRSKASGGR